MIKKSRKMNTGKRGFMSLNRKFCLVVILAVIAGYFILALALNLFDPILYGIYPKLNQINESATAIGKELYELADTVPITIGDSENIPEIDALIARYPQYDFKYEVYPGIDRGTFQLQGLNEDSEVILQCYYYVILDVTNGIIVAGMRVPVIERFGVILGIAAIVLFMITLLTIISIFVGRKVRYLKTINKSLEVIAGGDLNVRLPLKGRDEIFQVAWNINEMASALQKEILKEKQAEEARRQLVTNISHDLRTPLTAVLGYLSILETTAPEENAERVKQYIHCAYEKSNDLSRLVDQLFDYVLLTNQQMVFNLEAVEPSIVYYQLFSELEQLLEDVRITVLYSLEASDRSIRIDSSKFQRVAGNLFQNIRKYASPGTQVRVDGVRSGDQYILTVSNESAELLEEGYDYVCRYMTTAHGTKELNHQEKPKANKSAGLGLAICKELVEQQGGSFEVEAHQRLFKAIIKLPCLELE